MNTEVMSQLMVIIGVLVVFVNIITEVAKNLVDFKTTKSLNVFVTLLSLILTVISFVAFCSFRSIYVTWYMFVAVIVVGFMVAYAAMFGFDKLIKYFEKE